MFGVKISDAHCGMRAVRRDALSRLDLHSTGMEFASEMVFKAFRRDLKVSEIPIDYYPRVGESKLNRVGDAWRHVRFMLLYSPSWLFLGPGGLMLGLGLLGIAVLATGPVDVFGRTWQIHSLFACIALTLIGGQIVELWTFARTFARSRLGERDPVLERIAPHVSLERGIALGLAFMGLGLVGILRVLVPWVANGFGTLAHEYVFAVSLTAFGLGIEVVFASFFLALLTMRTTDRQPAHTSSTTAG
jgi:hypothetical protein